MNADVKNKWIKALNSEEYKQGKYFLRGSDGKFCCLGVLCDLHSKEKYIPWEDAEDNHYQYLERKGILPDAVASWSGLNAVPSINHRTIMSLNDDENLSFQRLAKLIKEHL